MNFGEALQALKDGHLVSREGWNGKGMWICLMSAVVIPEGIVNGRSKKFVPHGDLNVGSYFVMWTADRVWQPGWVASQADMVADDWEFVGNAVP